MVNYGNQILGLSLEVGSLEDLVSSDRYDLISMIQVISHFYDLQKALTTATAMTNPLVVQKTQESLKMRQW